MPRGRRPKPTPLKVLAGNPGRRPLNEHEPKPRREIPTPPPHLSGEALAEWNRITPELFRLGMLAKINRAGLAAYCQLWARMVEAEENLRKFGAVIKAPSGYPMQNPYLGIANFAIEELRKYLVEFGLTPSSQSKVQASDSGESRDESEDEFFGEVKAASDLLV